MNNPISLRGRVAQPIEGNRFTRASGQVTQDDLERYAEELNRGPMKGWCVKRQANGSYFLDRD